MIIDLARNGFMHLVPGAKLLYYFEWHDASGGEEAAALLANPNPNPTPTPTPNPNSNPNPNPKF